MTSGAPQSKDLPAHRTPRVRWSATFEDGVRDDHDDVLTTMASATGAVGVISPAYRKVRAESARAREERA